MKKFTQVIFAFVVLFLFSGIVTAQTQEASPFAPTTKQVVSNTDGTWDLLFNWNTTYSGEQAIESDGQYLYTTKWGAASASAGYFYKYDIAGTLLDSFLIPGVFAIRDLAYGNGYFYGGKNTTALYKMDFVNHTLVQTMTAGCANVRNLTVLPDGTFWAGGWSDLNHLSATGALLGTAPATGLVGMYGTAYDAVTPGGPYLWIFDQSSGAATPQVFCQFNIATQSLTGVTHDVSDIPGFDAANGIAGGCGTNVGIVAGKLVLIGNVQQAPNLVFGYELALAEGTPENPTVQNIVKVYPNPSTDMLKVKSGIYVIDKLTISNNIGQKVYEAYPNHTNNAQVNVSGWDKGIYFVTIETVEGAKTVKVAVK